MRKSPYRGEVPSREELHRLYIEEGLSLSKIGEALPGNPSVPLVGRWLRKYELGPRTPADGRRLAAKHGYSGEALENLRASAAEMRKRLGPESYAKISAANKGKPAPNKGKKHSEATKAKMRSVWDDERRERFAELRRGSNNPLWETGASADDRLHKWQWRKLSRQIFERDGYVCQECGQDLSLAARQREGRRIQCHHKIPVRLGGTDDPANLTTLCKSCHAKVEWRTFRRLSAL